MPNVIQGSPNANAASFVGINYNYDYGDLVNLRPGADLHKKIVNTVMEKARASHGVISNRFSSWNDIDQLLTTYVEPSEDDKDLKKRDPNKPRTIVFPYSYAVLETMLTYLSSAFFQDPIFKYSGTSPEDTIGAIQLEMVIQKHCQRNKVALALHTMFRDALAYGIGPVAPGWHVQTGMRKVMREQGGFSSVMGRLMGRAPVAEYKESILFEGNILHNIDPYCILPDSSVSAHNIQQGEFFGWIENTNLVTLLEREKSDDNYFNVQYLKHVVNKELELSKNSSARDAKHKISPDALRDYTKLCQVVHMYVNIIPSEWNLGDSKYPEKWLFSIGAGDVVIQARALGLNHGMYPIAMASPDYDGYSIAPISKLETQYGLQHTLNWLFNSHITNVRKALNDMLVVDPYMINIKDLQTSEPGKLVRMRRPAWGRGVRDAVMQLQVNDVTRQHIGDASWIINWMNNLVGTDESMMGSLRSGGPERLTKAEFNGTRNASMTRLEHMAKLISMQAMQDIAYFFASHTQQMMSNDTYVKTTGEWEARLRAEFAVDNNQMKSGRMKISPADLLIEYDIEYRDGSIPSAESAQIWMEMFTIIAEHPELNQRFDITRIFEKIARAHGEKNVKEFYRVVPDNQVSADVAKGNLVPAQQVMA